MSTTEYPYGQEQTTGRRTATRRSRRSSRWPHYDECAGKTDREIPVVVLERL